MNEQTNNTDSKTLLKVKNYMTRLIWIFSGAMTGRFLHVYFDYKSHPAMYSAPYRTLSDILKSELTWYGMIILICIIVISVLKIMVKKRSKISEA